LRDINPKLSNVVKNNELLFLEIFVAIMAQREVRCLNEPNIGLVVKNNSEFNGKDLNSNKKIIK